MRCPGWVDFERRAPHDRAMQFGHGNARRRLPPRSIPLTFVAVVLAAAVLLAPSATARLPAEGTSVDVPGVGAGPVITGPGIVWEDAAGIALLAPDGRSRQLAGLGSTNWDGFSDLAWFGEDWWVLATEAGLLGGRIGGALDALPVPTACNPASKVLSRLAENLYAIAGARLFAALGPGCLRRRSSGALLEVDLRTRRERVIASIPGEPRALAAAGGRVALAYVRSTRRGRHVATVVLLSARTGAVAATIAQPRTERAIEENVTAMQLDARGNLLVQTGCCEPTGQRPLAQIAQPPPPFRAVWWVPPGSRSARRLLLGREPVLSDGRVASVVEPVSGPTAIAVENLAAASTRAVVTFSGAVYVEGLAFAGNALAWAQRSSVIASHGNECATLFLSPPQLASIDLRAVGATPIAVRGVPAPPGTALCAGAIK
jgi:hypothetical protein